MTNKRNKFEPYDIVEVISSKRALCTILGKKGIVRGVSQSEEDPAIIAYAVDIPFSKINWFIFEDDLKATGKKANSEQVEAGFYVAIDKNGERLD